ncbi:beta,beta-carotene 15,15'-dioxygenase [Procambarus clarkii]|uniref:beta,beta-carotene 15,15'-dioxygenase n=1 Tax=Procambarus clarkii TaxID=6728 RepID=UPI001E678C06|nr:beta,beta-carotene 15,15'-dioxygenase-like [Procambarus clarkii]XP_045583183.1 beta,beta-carotene 15,15'-dioxygenase-like [Procambarus clarkii]
MIKEESTSACPPASQVWLRSCEKETLQPVQGKVTGKLPEWLNGRLTRNGPGKVQYGNTRYNHLFDGSAYIHQFNINNGKVTYQSRYLQSDVYKRNSKANRIVVSEFGTAAYPDPCKTLLQRFASFFTPLSAAEVTDNCVVNVCHFGDQLYALTETNAMRCIHPETLATIGGKTRLDQYIAVNTATAHPHVDPDGTVYNMGNSYHGKTGPTYNIIKFPLPKVAEGKKISSVEQAEIVATIPCQWKMRPSYYHSFGITDNYFIFVEQPFVFNLKKLIFNYYTGKPYIGALEWHPEEQSKFIIVKRDTGERLPTQYVADSFLTFHHTNTYEKDNHLVVDLVAMDNAETVYQLLLENLEKPEFECSAATMPTHRRYVLPLNLEDAEENTNLVTLKGSKCSALRRTDGRIQVQGHIISKQFFDLPRINYRHNGKEYTYAYGVDVNPRGIDFPKLVKMNVETGDTYLWREEGKLVSEPVFVAAPDASAEEHGVVLSTLIDKNEPKFVALLVVNPKTWRELARVEFEAEGAVTSTFHGQFAGANESVYRY